MRVRLAVMQFGQFYVWGAWLITIGAYGVETLGLSGAEVGLLFTIMGVASLIMPGLVGLLADTRVDSGRLYAALHAIGGVSLLVAATAASYPVLLWAMIVNSFAYMPTLSLGYSFSYAVLEERGDQPIAVFPRIRVWGTIGFIAAMWTVSLAGWELSRAQFVVAGVAGLVLAAYALTLPRCPPLRRGAGGSVRSALGLDALRFFRSRSLAVFLVFAFLLGTVLSVSGTWTDDFLHSFDTQSQFAGTFAVRYPAILISLSQMSEVVFILLIPFFLGRFGIRTVMLMSLGAWTLRFALLGFGDPGPGLVLLILAMIVYGAAFDFFNISGSLYVETQVPPESRASAQGAFMTMVNGWGAIVGGFLGGWLFDRLTTASGTDWRTFWLVCCGYAVVLAVLFLTVFRPPAPASPSADTTPDAATGHGVR